MAASRLARAASGPGGEQEAVRSVGEEVLQDQQVVSGFGDGG